MGSSKLCTRLSCCTKYLGLYLRLFSLSVPHAMGSLAAGGTKLVLPIHGRGVLQCSNIFSNLIGCMRRMHAAGASRLLDPIHGRGIFQRSNIISNLKGQIRCMVAVGGKSRSYRFTATSSIFIISFESNWTIS
jgi:hypothetical protein